MPMSSQVNVIDVRPGDEFAAGHVPGSINIALSGQFASWAGGILGIHSKPVLIGDTEAQIEEARLRLARVGIEDLRGYLAGGLAAWQKAGLPVLKTAQISPQELNQKLRDGSLRASDVLDVRREGEWQAGHIPQVECRALDTFPQGLPAIDREPSGCGSLQERISQHDWLQSARARGLSQCDQRGGRLRRVACCRTSRGCGTTRHGIVLAVSSHFSTSAISPKSTASSLW